MRWARTGMFAGALLIFGACGPCTEPTTSTATDGCSHPGICLTLTGPLAGSTGALVGAADCIPGNGLDSVFTTNIAGHETTVEIYITDISQPASPGFHPGTFKVRTRGGTFQGTGYASIWVRPDHDLSGYTGGWWTDGTGSSGTVTLDANEGGTLTDVIATSVSGAGSSLHIDGSFHCH